MSRADRADARSLKALPVRVAGFVFWGLLLIGLLIVVTMLDGREGQTRQRQQVTTNRFLAEL